MFTLNKNDEQMPEMILIENMVLSLKYYNHDQNKKTQKNVLPKTFRRQADNLSKALNTKVKINHNSNGKDSLTISFKGDREFERLISIINNN